MVSRLTAEVAQRHTPQYLKASLSRQLDSLLSSYHALDLYIAVSGGLDSIVLLDILSDLQTQYGQHVSLKVIHVNHGLSPNADQWQALVGLECAARGISYRAHRVVVDTRSNIEEQARKARYEVFRQTVCVDRETQNQGVLVLGHHGQDVAENFLLRLMRGSSPIGLGSMADFEDHYLGFKVWRPLVEWTRNDIESYGKLNTLAFVEDESNQDRAFSRNYLRHEVLPALKNRWSNAIGSIQQSHAYCREAAALADDMGLIDLEKAVRHIAPAQIFALDGQAVLALPEYRLKNLIRIWLKKQGVEQLRGSLFTAVQSGLIACVETPSSRQRLKIAVDHKKSLYLGFSLGCLFLYQERSIDVQTRVKVNQLERLSEIFGLQLLSLTSQSSERSESQIYNTKPGVIDVYEDDHVLQQVMQMEQSQWRCGQQGEKLRLHTKPYAMKLTKLWLEWRIPSALRASWPILVDDHDQVLYVPGCYFRFNKSNSVSNEV